MSLPLIKGQFKIIDIESSDILSLLDIMAPPSSFHFLAYGGGDIVYRIEPEAFREWKARVIRSFEVTDPTLLLDESYAGQYLYFTHASGCTVTLPDDLPEDRVFYLRAKGGNITLVGGGVMTLEPPKGGTTIMEPGDSLQINTIYDSGLAHITAHLIGSTQLAP